jgi:hypothetical protein
LTASTKLGINVSSISETLQGHRPSAGGLKFMKVKDYELTPREYKYRIKIIPLT